MYDPHDSIAEFDPELGRAMAAEKRRQDDHVELIASENYASPRVLEAQGSVLTNKYAEGYPGKRYYGGCEYVDIAERLAIDRAKQLFQCGYANVQPHSGSQANQAVYMATLNPGDTFLGMSLADGGHLTHGSPVNFSGKLYKVISYGLDADEVIDYAQMERLAHTHKPKLIVAGASAYSLVIDWKRFRAGRRQRRCPAHGGHGPLCGPGGSRAVSEPDRARPFHHQHHAQDLARPPRRADPVERGAREAAQRVDLSGRAGWPADACDRRQGRLLQRSHERGVQALPADGDGERPGDGKALQRRGLRIVSGGTESHMFLVDLRAKKVTGKEAEAVLGRAHITVNKNAIPRDPQTPFVTSGIRIGTPAVTTRGFAAAAGRTAGGAHRRRARCTHRRQGDCEGGGGCDRAVPAVPGVRRRAGRRVRSRDS